MRRRSRGEEVGMEGKCILYYSHKDVAKLEHLMRDKPLSEREVGAQLINETVAYAKAVCAVVKYYFTILESIMMIRKVVAIVIIA